MTILQLVTIDLTFKDPAMIEVPLLNLSHECTAQIVFTWNVAK